VATPITTQQIPAPLVSWGKNQGKMAIAMQSTEKTGRFWGNGFREKVGTLNMESTCEQSNRLTLGKPVAMQLAEFYRIHHCSARLAWRSSRTSCLKA
jgi:hypothetical protein